MSINIANHISHLLFEHDCVIIPDFGGFVGNYKPSRLDRVTHRFSPPSKEISFNKNLVQNDGLLANRISSVESIPFEEAGVILKKYSEEIKGALSSGKKVDVGEVGSLFSDEYGNYHFEPAEVKNFLADSFGLNPFHLVPVYNEPKIENTLRNKTVDYKFSDRLPQNEKAPVPNQAIVNSRGVKRKRGIIYIAAAVVPVLLFLLLLPFSMDKINNLGFRAKSFNYSNLVPFLEKPPGVYHARKPVSVNSAMETGNNPLAAISDSVIYAEINLFGNRNNTIVKMREVPESSRVIIKRERSGRFHIIAGCFQYYENARKMVSQLQSAGYDAYIVDEHKGLFRVSYKSLSSRKEAITLLTSLQSGSVPGAWLLVK